MTKVTTLVILTCLCVSAASAQTPTTTAPPPPAPTPQAAQEAEKLSAAPPAPATPKAKTTPLSIPSFASRPVIDGRVNEEIWLKAAVLKDFYQTRPGDNIAPSQTTEVLLGYDANYLYIAFRASDEAGKVRATVPKRDAIFNDDNVGIYLDTFNDQRRAYYLAFNPFGVQADALYTEGRGGGEDYSFDLIMESRGELTNGGYEVEVAIPFKSLRYKAGKGERWGVHAIRQIKRLNDEQDSWMPISRDIAGFLNQAGHITGLEDISTERTLEISPNLTLLEAGKRVPTLPLAVTRGNPALLDDGRFVNQPVGFDPGVNAKIGITPRITLDLTYNPDFAEIEADQPVITVNQRFPIFFPEKRPFFLEGIDIFRTQLNAVNTRAIIEPDFAAKLTGKKGRNTFGLLMASDEGPGNFVGDERLEPRNLPFIDKKAYIGIMRLKRDVGSENSVGVVATSYSFIERHSQLGGFDGRFRIDPRTFIDFQVLGTTTRRVFFDVEQGRNLYRTGNGFGYFGRYSYTGRKLLVVFAAAGRTRYFRTEVGFTRRFNTNQHELTVSYGPDPKPKARLISWRLLSVSRTNFDWQRRMQNWNTDASLSLEFRRQTRLSFGLSGGYERLFEEEFGPRRTPTRQGAFAGDDPERSTNKTAFFMTGSFTPNKKYSGNLSLTYTSNAFDLDAGAGRRFPRVSPGALLDPRALRDPGTGDALDMIGSFIYQPTAALRMSLDFTKSRLLRHDTRRVSFDDNIFIARATYQFTRFTFARARVDYDTLAANMRSQLLVGWAPNPGTSFYVGYNDDLNRNGFNPFTGQPEPGFRRNGRAFFIKMSYLFQYTY